MKLIIDIPDYEYKNIKEYYEKNDNVEATYSYIYHGTPLSEELEKIKTRLNHRANEHLDGDYYVRIKDINEVFYEKLSELKGEQE